MGGRLLGNVVVGAINVLQKVSPPLREAPRSKADCRCSLELAPISQEVP